jgi:quercetin dioxygenase-like cupin family protein
MSQLRRLRLVLLVLVAVAVGVAVDAYAGARSRTAGPAPVVREALAATNNPIGGKGRTLGLSRVLIAPGAQLALHRHPGTQVAFIAEGVLTYTVKSGSVSVMRGSADGSPTLVHRIGAGQSGTISAGQWIVERPSTIHRAANNGKKRIVVYLATLFPIGSPPAIPVR